MRSLLVVRSIGLASWNNRARRPCHLNLPFLEKPCSIQPPYHTNLYDLHCRNHRPIFRALSLEKMILAHTVRTAPEIPQSANRVLPYMHYRVCSAAVVAGFFTRGRMGIMIWFDRIGFLGLMGLYVGVVIAVPIIGALLFFFPILPLYELMGWEFSNLGPIATFFWGIMFDI